MRNPFSSLAAGIYRKIKPITGKKRDPKIYKALSQLHPLENAEELYDNFQIRKLAFIFMILTIGIVSAICLHLCSRMEGKMAEGAWLVRNEKGVGDYRIILRAETENWSREIPFLVEERELTKEEDDALKEELCRTLPDIIKNENTDLSHVTGDLNLVSAVSGYPYGLIWSSGDSGKINANGQINRGDIGKEGEKISLSVTVTGGRERTVFTYEVFLLPEKLGEEDRFFKALEEIVLQEDADGKSRKQIVLPERLLGKSIVWKEVKQDSGIFLFFLFLLGSLFVGRGMESDLGKSCKERNRQLITAYPGFVSKLSLYLSAGLTVRRAFLRMRADYVKWQEQEKERGKKPWKKRRKVKQGEEFYLLKEMEISCYQLENGVMEEQVYQDFGRRCGEMRYRRLSFLLAVQLKQGNDQLLMLLAKEADDAQEDRKNLARKAGEEASTKLLFPMMLMLALVMLLVLAPAYLGFGSI